MYLSRRERKNGIPGDVWEPVQFFGLAESAFVNTYRPWLSLDFMPRIRWLTPCTTVCRGLWTAGLFLVPLRRSFF